jgi:5'-deoxynucleotidase YfbR-like HD superfamily hydrolase
MEQYRGRVEGPTILLGSGNYYDFEDPEGSNPSVEDMVYGLAFTCRGRGQLISRRTGRRVFYSVADHCEIMSRIVPPHLAYDALMHEAGEVFTGDAPGPLKSIAVDFKAVEKACETAEHRRLNVTMSDKTAIKKYDLVMLATERRDLMNWNGERWPILDGVEPLGFEIVPRTAEASAEAFRARFMELAPREVLRAFAA